MKFEIINPHDKAYIEADDPKVAAVAIFIIGRGNYGLEEIDGDFEMPVLIFAPPGWFEDTFEQTLQQIYDEIDQSELKKVLLSVHLKGERSSMTDMVARAQAQAKNITDWERHQNATLGSSNQLDTSIQLQDSC